MILFSTYLRPIFLLNKSDCQEIFISQFLKKFYDCPIIQIFSYLDCVQNTLIWIIGISLYLFFYFSHYILIHHNKSNCILFKSQNFIWSKIANFQPIYVSKENSTILTKLIFKKALEKLHFLIRFANYKYFYTLSIL